MNRGGLVGLDEGGSWERGEENDAAREAEVLVPLATSASWIPEPGSCSLRSTEGPCLSQIPLHPSFIPPSCATPTAQVCEPTPITGVQLLLVNGSVTG